MPDSIDGETFFSSSIYFGDEEIHNTNLKSGNQMVLRVGNWYSVATKIHNNTYYIKLETRDSKTSESFHRYLKIELVGN